MKKIFALALAAVMTAGMANTIVLNLLNFDVRLCTN